MTLNVIVFKKKLCREEVTKIPIHLFNKKSRDQNKTNTKVQQ